MRFCDDSGLNSVVIALKSYNTAVPGQAAVCCTIELHKAHPFDPAAVVSVEADVFQDAYDFMGGG